MSAPSAALLRACSLLLCLVAGSRQVSITEFTVPDAVEVGESAELRCRYELEADETDAALYVKWWWSPNTNTTDYKQLIYQHIVGHAAERVHHNKLEIKENDTIILTELTPVDSGIYECEVSNIDEIRKHEELIVFSKGTGPELNITTVVDDADESEDLVVKCEAADVAPLPYLAVTINGKGINITEILSGPDNNSMYIIHANATLNKEDVEEGEIQCELFYTNPNISHPQYVDTETYANSGDAPSSTQVPEEATLPDATTEPLNSSDASYRVNCSWLLPIVAAMLTQLRTCIYIPM